MKSIEMFSKIKAESKKLRLTNEQICLLVVAEMLDNVAYDISDK